MAYSNVELRNFTSYFAGNDLAYGVTKVGEIKDGKAEADSHLVHEQLTFSVMAEHLSGKKSIGVAPIMMDSKCWFGAIDIDNYSYDLADIVRAIYDFKLPLFPCWSKSKKLHIYMFFSEPASAASVREILRWYADLFCCDKKTELFPKQDRVDPGAKFFSWINIPYFNASSDNWRKQVKRDMSLADLSDALEYIKSIRMTEEEHRKLMDDFPYKDAPPCVTSGILLRDIPRGSRNAWLFSVGVYFRLKDENCDLEEKLKEINSSLQDPIPDDELEKTVIKSLSKHSYFYMCSSMPRCDKTLCRHREFGVDSKMSTGLDFGQLTQYMTDPPYYEWIVNGQRMTFWNEKEILAQGKFRELCLRQLHLVPRSVNDERWSKILTRACENIKVVHDDEIEGDFSPGATFYGLMAEFFDKKRQGSNLSTVFLGKVFLDTETNEFIFTARAFTEFLMVKHGFTSFTSVEIQDRLKRKGAYKKDTLWHIPADSVKQKNTEAEVDFKLNHEEGMY